jgi:MarR family transcriptional regulator, 2-MHQ and catechol-resistance regulon repressor
MIEEQVQTDLGQQVIDRFWETIPPVWHLVRNHIHTLAIQNYNISVEQFHILRHISKGVDSVSELATIKHISRPAVSQAINGLVEQGLVSRSQQAQDRRYVHLILTETGQYLLNEIFEETRGWMSSRLSILSKDEMENMIVALGSLKRALSDDLEGK